MSGPVPSTIRRAMNDWSPGQARMLVLLAATIVGIYVCYLLVAPFLPALAWALTLAVAFDPVHRWSEARLKRSSLSATVSVLVVVVVVVVPGLFVAERLIEEGARGAVAIRTAIESGEWQRGVESHPRVAPLVDWIGRQLDLPSLIGGAISWLTNTTASLVRGSIAQAIGFLLTFYFLFYFLRDRQVALTSLMHLSPLSEDEWRELTSRATDTIYATVYGTIVCSLVQGTLGGLMFWWLGLPTPLLWGVIMGLLAIVPVFGAFVVWIPAAVALALEGHWGQALILTAWGSVVVGGIDNVLYPILVGNRLRLHTIPAFVSVVGGLVVFGASGVVLGPLAVTTTLALLEIWRGRASARLDEQRIG